MTCGEQPDISGMSLDEVLWGNATTGDELAAHVRKIGRANWLSASLFQSIPLSSILDPEIVDGASAEEVRTRVGHLNALLEQADREDAWVASITGEPQVREGSEGLLQLRESLLELLTRNGEDAAEGMVQ